MSRKGIEIPENVEVFSTIDGKKNLTFDQIFSDFLQYLGRDGSDIERFKKDEKLLRVATRMFLIRKRYLEPSQQPNEGVAKELFEKIIQRFQKKISQKDWRIQSALRHQWNEEDRAGQTYTESDLE